MKYINLSVILIVMVFGSTSSNKKVEFKHNVANKKLALIIK